MTSKMLLEQYMAERRALGFSLKTDEGCIRRFLQDFVDPDDGDISFTKEYVLSHIGNRRNMQTNPRFFRLCYDGRTQLYGTLPPDPQNSEYGSSNAAS